MLRCHHHCWVWIDVCCWVIAKTIAIAGTSQCQDYWTGLVLIVPRIYLDVSLLNLAFTIYFACLLGMHMYARFVLGFWDELIDHCTLIYGCM